MAKKLLGQRRAFADFIISGQKSQTQAYIDAGFAETGAAQNACLLMQVPEVAEYIEAAQKIALDAAGVTAEWIIAQVVDQTALAKAEGNHNAVFKGLELLGKNKKLWTDVQEHQFQVTQMGNVMINDPNAIDGESMKVLEFNVGEDPDKIEDANK